MNIAVCDFDLLVEAAFCHGGFVSETPKFLRGGLRRNFTRKIECRSLISTMFCSKHSLGALALSLLTFLIPIPFVIG